MEWAIALGAFGGALSRFYITEWVKAKFESKFPIATFGINLSGCLLIGFFFAIFSKIPSYPPALDLFIRTGFLGSYTTFSTYGFDTLILWRNRQTIATVFYGVGSAILGLGAVIIGGAIANFFVT